eukprot:gene5874-6793_t
MEQDNVNNDNQENEEEHNDDEEEEENTLGDLSDLLIPSLNIPELLDELDQHSDTLSSSNNSNVLRSSNTSSGSVGSGKNDNMFLKGSGSAPRSLGYQIFRTFPYRGSLPSPLAQIINALGEKERLEEEALAEAEKIKTKPSCSTNGLRHSRQIKGLLAIPKLNMTDVNSKPEITINNNSNSSSSNNNNPITEDSTTDEQQQQPTEPSPSFLDSSFFQPPPAPSPRSIELQEALAKQTTEPLQLDQLEAEQPPQQEQQEDQSTKRNSTQWNQLFESLEEQSKPDDLGFDLPDDLNIDDLEVPARPVGNEAESTSPEASSSTTPLKETSEILPPSFSSSPATSIASSPSYMTMSPVSSSPKRSPLSMLNQNNTPATISPVFVESKTNACRIKGQLDLIQSGDTNIKKKAQLSRTITFSDPTSIYSFFGNQADLSSSEPVPASTQVAKGARGGIASLFPKIHVPPSAGHSSSPAASKFFYPLLQPQPTTLIRGFAEKADINIKGLKRAKKTIDMEDEWLSMHPFGDDPQMALFCIFDGHSGKNVAITAKEILPNILLKYIQTARNECGKQIYDMRGVFLATFKEVDAQLSKFEYEGATTTVVLIWRVGEQRFLQSANVGDSSAFLRIIELPIQKNNRESKKMELY